MKTTIHNLFRWVILSMAALVLASCESDDYDTADTLNGIWQGSLGTYYADQYGEAYSEWSTEFRFYTNDGYTTSGVGVEIDYNPYNPYSGYYTYEFKWEVAYGNIYLHFSNGDELVIRDYSLSDSYLRGYLETYDGVKIAQLSLERSSYWPWDDDYYSYAKETRAAADSTVANPHEGVKRHFAKE
ncbi:MAG: hypothetical protein ACOYJF_04020 [Prevotella sp.]|jgi:hypothetical protein